jgi:hypothetical protein
MPQVNSLPRVLPGLTAFPASPYVGRTFRHTGRNIDYEWSGAIWVPKFADVGINLYVNALGTNDHNHGFGPGADAYLTLQYAWSMIPLLQHNTAASVTINLPAAGFAENLWLSGVNPTNRYLNVPYAVTFVGTPTLVASLVATVGVKGAAAARAQVNGAFVVGVHDGRQIRFTSGANNLIQRVIGQTTAGVLYLEGGTLNAQPVNGDTYDILDYGTTITGRVSIGPNQAPVIFSNLSMTYNVGDTVLVCWQGSYFYLQNSSLVQAGPNRGIWISLAGGEFHDSYLRQTVAPAAGSLIFDDMCAGSESRGCKIAGTGAAGVGVWINTSALHHFVEGDEISAFSFGAVAGNHSPISFFTPDITHRIHGCNVNGARADSHGAIFSIAGVTFGLTLAGGADVNGANTFADAAAFSILT